MITIKCSERNGPLVAIRNVQPDEELMVITRNGIIIRLSVEGISSQGRNTQGVRIISLNEGDMVGGITKVAGNGSEPEDLTTPADEAATGDDNSGAAEAPSTQEKKE
jgi:DNA gyrase subunit A